MCLAVPGKIMSIDNTVPDLRMAKVDFGGIMKTVCIQWIDAEVDDYILAHAGMAISAIDEEAALATLNDFETLAEFLKDERE